MYQQVIVVGNVGRDVNLKYTQSGVAVADFSIAVNKRFTSSTGEKREEVTWFKITCWRKLAEMVGQYVTKGKLVMVIGEIKASAYLDKSGQPAATLELTANDIRFLGSRDGQQGGTGEGGYQDFGGAPQEDLNDIPF
jgi:single-strand DNA-binding protein